MKPAHRAACVEAINAFRKAHDLPLVICSRTADYQALDVPLQLDGAIIVQPLSPQQVDSYLTEIGTAGAAVKRAMDHDPMLREMLDSPLMLNIVTVAYAGQPGSQPQLSGTLKERRDHLFGAYVDQMFRRRGVERRYPPQRTVHWLTWLAWQMVRHSQTVFYIERLQPDWLGEKGWEFGLVDRLVGGLVGGLGFGLVAGLVAGLVRGLAGGLFIGLVIGLVSWLGFGLASHSDEKIKCVETVRWSWSNLRRYTYYNRRINIFIGLVATLVGGLLFGLVGGLGYGLVGGLLFGLVSGLIGGQCGGLVSGLSFEEIKTRAIPNEGIHRSARHSMILGLLFGLVSGLGYGLVGALVGGLRLGVVTGLSLGLSFVESVGMDAGGDACLKHVILRLWLIRNGSTPWNFVRFLDYADERILLRKVGGGYIFIHRMLLEYFAARYDESSVEATSNAKPLKTSKIIWYISSGVALFALIICVLVVLFILFNNNASMCTWRGDFWYDKKEYDRAIADYDQAIRLDPKYTWAYNNRGRAWYDKGEYDRAIADYDQAIRLDPKYTWAYNNRGRAWYDKGEYDKAIADYGEAIRIDPKYHEAYHNRGNAWKAKQEYGMAIADLGEAVRLRPKEAEAHCDLGRARYDKGEYDQAIADYDQAIRLNPKFDVAYYSRGTAWYHKKEYDKAIADYDQAIALDPKFDAAYHNRGTAWYAKQAYDQAIADYDRAIALDPKFALAYNNRAWFWATCPDKKYRDGRRAVESANRACELTDWKEADHLDTLAAAYAECGDFAHAIEYQEKAQGLYKDEKDREKGRDRLALYREKKPYRVVPEVK